MKKILISLIIFANIFQPCLSADKPKSLIDFVENIEHVETRKKYPISESKREKIYDAINLFGDKLQFLENIKICKKCNGERDTIAYVMNNGNTVFVKDDIVDKFTDDEFYWIIVHEFVHIIDFRYFHGDKGSTMFCNFLNVNYGDKSLEFYDISWKKCKLKKTDDDNFEDFVTDYAMLNSFEDFAESVTFYVRNNRKMKAIAFNNEAIRLKYNWIRYNVFNGKVFKTGDNKIYLSKRTTHTYTSNNNKKNP